MTAKRDATMQVQNNSTVLSRTVSAPLWAQQSVIESYRQMLAVKK